MFIVRTSVFVSLHIFPLFSTDEWTTFENTLHNCFKFTTGRDGNFHGSKCGNLIKTFRRSIKAIFIQILVYLLLNYEKVYCVDCFSEAGGFARWLCRCSKNDSRKLAGK